MKHKTCIHIGCETLPTYNNRGETKRLYCTNHKLEGMVNVKSKTCIYEGCETRPGFNNEGETKALYCANHKLEGMVDVKHKPCIHERCKKQPAYNNKGETKALYCANHKFEGMVDVINKTCISERCEKRPAYNNDGETKALYCNHHKLEGMINVKSKTCKTYLCSTIVHRHRDKYDGYCLRCYMFLFPDKPVSRNYKTKEYAVVEYVTTNFSQFPWIADKTVSGGCSKRRPDLMLDLGYQILIIEVDENQHIDYECSCENKRIMELSQDLGHIPIIFIRFNPDDYQKDGENITSCWGQDKNGICVVKKIKRTEWSERLNTLSQHIHYWTHPSNITHKTIETIQLYYDM